MTMKLKLFNYLKIVTIGVILTSCAAGVDDTGLEYAPQMYHSTPYEPLTQIVDKKAGSWLDSNEEDGHGEFYNSNPYNKFNINERDPVPNTVRRGHLLPVRLGPDDLEIAAKTLKSPYSEEENVSIIKDAKLLYKYYCLHCHGEDGSGSGKVAEAYAGVPNLNGVAYLEVTEGHIFHVLTYGKGLLDSHASQISPEDRWKLARYIKHLEKN